MDDSGPSQKATSHLLSGVVLVLLIGGFWLLSYTPPAPIPPPIEPSLPVETIEGPILEKALPVLLSIPKINLSAPFEEPVGLAPDNSIAVPKGYETVAWYEHGPTPGELGPAVVLGHVDSVAGPAIFFSLGQLAVGDDIFINRANGSVAHFKVTALERYEQAAFPTSEIYGDINHAGLRLITCTGTYERGKQRYSHNLVVYAQLVS